MTNQYCPWYREGGDVNKIIAMEKKNNFWLKGNTAQDYRVQGCSGVSLFKSLFNFA